MASIPVAGYPSKHAAVWAMLDQGKSHDEIATLCDTSPHQVYVMASSKRHHDQRHLSVELRAKAQRIYYESLKTIGAALGVEPQLLHDVYRKLLFKDFDFLVQAEQSLLTRLHPESPTMSEVAEVIVQDNEELIENETSELPESYAPSKAASPRFPRKPYIEPTVGAAKWVTLWDPLTNVFLNMDGTGITRDKQYAYKATNKQAAVMQANSPFAKDLHVRAW